MGRDARLNPNSQEGKPLEFTPATDMLGTRLAIGDLVLMQPGPAFQPIYELTECRPDLRPGVPAGAHMLVFASQFPAGVTPGAAVPGVRVALRRDNPEEQQKAEEPSNLIVMPGSDTPRREVPRG